MEVDRRSFFAALGVGTLGLMDPEEKAEALEHYMLDVLDEPEKAAAKADAAEEEEQQLGVHPPRTGRLLLPRSTPLEPMPDKPTFLDFFRLRLSSSNHCLQSATHALESGQPERTVMACLLHVGSRG